MIYRVDPATGKASVFFDLNTVKSQSNSNGDSTGLVNWYDLAFDPEGYFDGRPSLFVSSFDSSDPSKNVIYRIGPDGSFMGVFVQSSPALASQQFNVSPTSIVVPPVEDQSFLRGLIAGSGFRTSVTPDNPNGQFVGLFFAANAYSPGSNLPTGVSQVPGLVTGPQVGLTAANADYPSRVYSAFTDFGTPAQPGPSGVQGINGEYLITGTTTATGSVTATNPTAIATSSAPVPLTPDAQPLVTTSFRRFEDVAFDQYGYFSQGITTSTTTTSTGTTTTSVVPTSAGSLFVADLATGLSVQVTPQAPLSTTPINVPIQGPGTVGVTTDAAGNFIPITTNGNTTDGSNVGGRILRITPQGVVTTFAQGFNTSGNQDASSFANSSLSISFSADGTILYASDDDGIWQFKTTASLASSSTGSYVGLNDLRSLGVPYEGQNTAVAIVDTGVDASVPSFRGRVSPGFNVITNGLGNSDTSPGTATTTTTTTGSHHQHHTRRDRDHAPQLGRARHHGRGRGRPVRPSGDPRAGGHFQSFPVIHLDEHDHDHHRHHHGDQRHDHHDLERLHDHQCGLPRLRLRRQAPVRQRPGPTEPGRSRGRGHIRLRHLRDLRQRGVGLSSLSPDRDRLQEPAQEVPEPGHRADRRHGPVRRPVRRGGPLRTTTGTTSTTTTTRSFGTNNATNATVGDVNGIAFPAILNEVISVTGTYPFPYTYGPTTTPNLPPTGVAFGSVTPVLIGTGFGGIPPSTTTTGPPPNHHQHQHRHRDRRDRCAHRGRPPGRDLRRPDPRVEQPQRHHRLRRPGDRRPHVPQASLRDHRHQRDHDGDHAHLRPQRAPHLPGRGDLPLGGHRHRGV